MANTLTAMYSQNSTQQGSTLATAFPGSPTQGVGSQNFDILQIVSKKGQAPFVSVDYLGTVYFQTPLTQVIIINSQLVGYAGTIPGAAGSGLAGRQVSISGFSNSGNNGIFTIVSSATNFIRVALTSQVNEINAAQAVSFTGNQTRIGQFETNFGPSDSFTLAQLFADAFVNFSQQDIFQAINLGGNIHYYLDFQGVPHGS